MIQSPSPLEPGTRPAPGRRERRPPGRRPPRRREARRPAPGRWRSARGRRRRGRRARPSPWRRSTPSSGTTSATSRSSSVRVPVLSVHTTSTRARPSMAASSCTSTCRRPRRSTLAVKATLVSSTSPSGIIAPMPGHRAADGVGQRLVRAHLAVDQQRGGRHDQPGHEAQDLVGAPAQLGPDERELAGLGRELVGVARGADLARPGTSPARRSRSCPTAPGRRGPSPAAPTRPTAATRRPRVRRPVSTVPSATIWVPWRELDDVVGHDVLDPDVARARRPARRSRGARSAARAGRACAWPATPGRSRWPCWSPARRRTGRPGSGRPSGSRPAARRGWR